MTKWNYGVFFLNFSHVGQQEPSLTINNALETLRIMDEDTSIYDVVAFSEHHIDKSYNDETKLAPFVSLGNHVYLLATNTETVVKAAKYGMPLLFKWDDSQQKRIDLLNHYQAAAAKFNVDITDVRHRLMVFINVNDNPTQAKAELSIYLEDYLSYTQAEASIDEIINSNAAGNVNTCFTHIEEMAQGLNNKVDFLFCFESIKLQDNKKSLMINIDKIVINYRKRHQLK
ncbi:LLM class flavin-dependent oxidoreductase [Photobacterium leiognathi]|uniref:LLM class flavin-dependent oxidoreductase n=1 Tax=Photobacterium leiognathi TaxID=553611 RepID=UPI002981DFB7|nr:LLM class flavin-dependent oxidoreductase [Photobacterium leiognathi]